MHAERILIVEDNLPCAERFRQALALCFNVEHVPTLQRACARLGPGESATEDEEKYCTPAIHCIVLNQILPNGRGVTLVDRFQNRYPAIPLVVVTGYEGNEKALIHAGAHAILTKPYLSDRLLLDTVVQTIARHQVRQTFEPLDQTVQELKQEQKENAQRLEQAKQESAISLPAKG